MCTSECCNDHFSEWKKESTCAWILVKTVLLLFFAGVLFCISGMESSGEWAGPAIFEPEKLVIVIIFFILFGFLAVLYTPWQHKVAPWWLKILTLVLYFGSLGFLFWEYHIAKDGGVLPDTAAFRTNETALDLWTVNHFFVGLVLAWMLPFWWMLLVVIGWEFMEILVYGEGDELIMNAVVDVVVAIVAWWIIILIFSRHCIPWISSRCTLETKTAKTTAQFFHADETNYDTYV